MWDRIEVGQGFKFSGAMVGIVPEDKKFFNLGMNVLMAFATYIMTTT